MQQLRNSDRSIIDLDAVVVPDRHAPIIDTVGAHISPSPRLLLAVKLSSVTKLLEVVKILRTRKAAKRLWLAEAATRNRTEVLEAIQTRSLGLPEVREAGLRFFDGRRMRSSLTQAEHKELHSVKK